LKKFQKRLRKAQSSIVPFCEKDDRLFLKLASGKRGFPDSGRKNPCDSPEGMERRNTLEDRKTGGVPAA